MATRPGAATDAYKPAHWFDWRTIVRSTDASRGRPAWACIVIAQRIVGISPLITNAPMLTARPTQSISSPLLADSVAITTFGLNRRLSHVATGFSAESRSSVDDVKT